jgi:ABC-type cobalamin/Fe3+-siderophores transport system ATPase subunit
VKFYDLIAQLNRDRHVTVVLVSHDTSMVSQHVHHVLCLKDGTIQCQGPPHAILNPETLRQVFGAETAVFAHRH